MVRRHLLFGLMLLLVGAVGIGDYLVGAQASMVPLYAVPIMVAAQLCGAYQGTTVALCAAAVWTAVSLIHLGPSFSASLLSWNALSRLGIFLLIAYAVTVQSRLGRARERLRQLAVSDPLTGLLNRGTFRERVMEEMNRARRYHHPLTVALIDLDDFNRINEEHGQARGDTLLQLVGRTIMQTVRTTDLVGRTGGDEFMVLLPETDGDQARVATEKLLAALDIMTSQSGWQATASIGVVSYREFDDTYDAMFARTERLMRKAKVKGKNGAEFQAL